MQVAVSEIRKAFAVTYRNNEDPPAYTSASQRASSVIVKAKAEAWQATCLSLLPKSDSKSVYSLRRSATGSSFSSSSSPNFPNCSSPRESALVFPHYLRCHFSVSKPKTLPSRARGSFSKLRQATPESLIRPSAPASSLLNFSRVR